MSGGGYGSTGLRSGETEALRAKLSKERKQPVVVILQQSIFTIYLFGACGKESLEEPIKVFSS